MVLLKSVLLNLLVYYISFFRAPMSVLQSLDKARRDFFLGSDGECRKFHLMGWNNIYKPKEQGGLGIRLLKKINLALLYKWLWRFGEERSHLRRRMVATKMGESDSGWRRGMPVGSRGIGPWKVRVIFSRIG